MKIIFSTCIALLATTPTLAQTGSGSPQQVPQKNASAPQLPLTYGLIPLSFEPNRGQTAAAVQWIARGPQYSLFLSGDDAVLELNSVTPPQSGEAPKISSMAVRMELAGAKPARNATGEDPLPGKANYFSGNDPAKWQREVPTFGRVRLQSVYPGIDLVYYGKQGRLEYDFVVAPGADASTIRLNFDGATAALAANGDLVLPVAGAKTEVRFDKPVVYQMKDGVREPVSGDFLIAKDHQVSFQLGTYDRNRELIIDPTLIFDGTLGTGNQQTIPAGMAVDAAGEIVLTGYTNDLTFPVTMGALQTNCQTYSAAAAASGYVRCGVSSATSAFVTKISADGKSLVYSTYLHGGGGAESGQSVAVDAAGDAYVLGDTSSNDFPITSDAYQSQCQPTYQLLSFFPVAVYGPILPECDNFYNGGGTEYTVNGPTLFIAKLNPSGTALLYSTFFGGTAAVYPVGIALDKTGNIYFASSVNPGYTVAQLYPNNDSGAIQFPLTASAYQATAIGVQEPALSELSADGHTLLYSTFLGSQTTGQSNFSISQAFTLGQNGVAFIGGWTNASDFPTTQGSIKPACTLNPNNAFNCSNGQAWVAAIDTTKSGAASLVYSTYLGGNAGQPSNLPEQEVNGLAADSSNNLYVTGYTLATDFPTTAGAYQTTCNNLNSSGSCNTAFLSKINPTGTALVWSTYFGGTINGTAPSAGNAIALDAKGRVYLYGFSQDGGGDFPQVNPFQAYTSGDKVVVATFSPDATQLLFSTRFGSGSTTVFSNALPISNGIEVDATGNIYFAGYSNDGGTFVTTPGTYSTTGTAGFFRGFFGKISPIVPPTTTTLTITPASQTVGQSVQFSVTVSSTAQTTLFPTGIVTLSNTSVNPTVTLGTITLNSAGSGTFSTSSLALGTYTVTASYNGDGNDDLSVSTPQTVTIAQAMTRTTLSTSAANIASGQSETLTATISGGFFPAVTGRVTFSDQNGVLGSTPVTATETGGTAALTLTTLAAGSHQITAMYSGDTNYVPSTSGPQPVVVSLSPTLLTVAPATGLMGSGATSVTLTGANFTASDVVQLNGATITSSFVSATTLTAVLPASFFAAAGTGLITVHDPVGGTTTSTVSFVVTALPGIVFTGPPTAPSGQQPALTFTLTNPYPTPLAGVLTLAFVPASSTAIDDPAVQFSTGSRVINFNIPANSTATPAVQLQTGTVAGTATVTLAVTTNGVNVTPSNVVPVVIVIPAAAPSITTGAVARNGQTLNVSVVGFSNTRQVTTAIFHFTPVAGGNISNPDFTVDVTSAFATWFASAASGQYGSEFTYTQAFTLDSNASVVQNVTVTLVNSVGKSAAGTAQ